MNREHETILGRAATWHLATMRDDMDWDGFTHWLEADPRHRAAYDEIALTDTALAHHSAQVATVSQAYDAADQPANDDGDMAGSAWRRLGKWGGAAIAASLVALAIAPQIQGPAPQQYATVTTSLAITLDDGSKIELAPKSTLTVNGRHQEELALEGGAWFNIRHDPSRAMTIRAGDMAINDIGTSFDVQATPGQLRVEVAEGAVSVSSERLSKPVHLIAGHGFHFDGSAGTAETVPVQKDNFGEWRQGRLSYEGAPLALVAIDLSRYAGIDVSLTKEAENRRFSGTLAIVDGKAAVRDLAQLMGLALERDGAGYRLGAGSD